MNDALAARMDKFERRSWIVGGAALAVCLIGWWLDPEHLLHGYLIGFLFWIGIVLGCFAVLMLHHLVGGEWGWVIRRLLESGTRTVPLMAVLVIPLLASISRLYPWAGGSSHGGPELHGGKHVYLTIPFFLGRTVLYFAVWFGLAFLLNRWSREQDRTNAPALEARFQNFSGPGLLLYGLTATFASVDWVMSLEPEWYSTIFGALFMVGQVLATLAFVVAVILRLSRHDPIAAVLTPGHLHDLGNLMLAFVMLWAYMSFSQFLIIWAGNLPEEIPWYLSRIQGGWQWIAIVLIVLHFALPFLLLLSRDVKRRAGMLSRVAAFVIVMRLVDLFWWVEPAFHARSLAAHWADVVAPVGIGGVWLAYYVRQLRSWPLVPLHGREPRGEELHGIEVQHG